MIILGISAFYHDSAAVLLKDGKVLCAFEEERFSRIKHDNQFPYKAIEACLTFGGITIDDVEAVAYYERPLRKFERILTTFVETFPFSLVPYVQSMSEWFGYKIDIESVIKKKVKCKGDIFYIPHHLSHASHAFFTSPYEEAAILTIDGVGEYQTTGLWKANKEGIEHIASIGFPHSLGLLYSTFTAFLGFQVNEDEYKLMGLAAYGSPIYEDEVRKVISVKEDGSFKLNMNYFGFRESFHMWRLPFEDLFGKPRKPETELTQEHKDIAASVQKVVEDTYVLLLTELQKRTELENACISGGVSLNALANGKVLNADIFKSTHIPGSGGDSGGALGAAMYLSAVLKKEPVSIDPILLLGNAALGSEIEKALQEVQGVVWKKVSEEEVVSHASDEIAKGNVIGWFQGRMEFGPRALGSRSLLAKPSPASMKDRANQIKMREDFRPFGGVILSEYLSEYFTVSEGKSWFPDMNVCFQVKKEGIEAITHKDNSCRIQTADKRNGIFYDLIQEVKAKTGVPCVLNTSFNIKGEPIVENPAQAIDMFLHTAIDVLYIENYIIEKAATEVA